MTALASTQSIPRIDPVPRLLGLRPVVAKEIHEWFANHRAPMLFVVTTLMMVLSTLSARIATVSVPAAQLPPSLSLDPTVNVLVKWDQWVFFFAIVFSTSLLIVERDRGTLAWSLSKPLSRRALLAASGSGPWPCTSPSGSCCRWPSAPSSRRSPTERPTLRGSRRRRSCWPASRPSSSH
jgi:hypothetical protein